MPQEICLRHIEEDRFMVVDCETGKPTSLIGEKKKEKRKPSKYNLHIKECVKRKSGPIQERFKSCAKEWKKKKSGKKE